MHSTLFHYEARLDWAAAWAAGDDPLLRVITGQPGFEFVARDCGRFLEPLSFVGGARVAFHEHRTLIVFPGPSAFKSRVRDFRQWVENEVGLVRNSRQRSKYEVHIGVDRVLVHM